MKHYFVEEKSDFSKIGRIQNLGKVWKIFETQWLAKVFEQLSYGPCATVYHLIFMIEYLHRQNIT